MFTETEQLQDILAHVTAALEIIVGEIRLDYHCSRGARKKLDALGGVDAILAKANHLNQRGGRVDCGD